jgi:hypothetical protein
LCCPAICERNQEVGNVHRRAIRKKTGFVDVFFKITARGAAPDAVTVQEYQTFVPQTTIEPVKDKNYEL